MSNLKQYESGFVVNGKHPIETVEWLFNRKDSTETKLVFLAYDANLYLLPDFSTWCNEKWKQKQISNGLKRTHDFDGEVWLDDVRIK